MSRVTEVLSATRQSFFSQHKEKTLKGEFERVALSHLSDLYKVAFYFTKNEAEAEDLVQETYLRVQETYLRAFRFFDKFKPGTNCKAWLLTILRNLFINRYRQKTRGPVTLDCEELNNGSRSSFEQKENNHNDNPENSLSSKELVHGIGTAVKELPGEFRMAIVLVDIAELTYEEAGQVMGCPIGTVRSRVFRGRMILQVALRDCALEQAVTVPGTPLDRPCKKSVKALGHGRVLF